jgi:hypothetical protein
MRKSKARKTPDIFVKVDMNGCDTFIVNRLYRERDTKALDSMGVKVAAVPARCFRNTIMWNVEAARTQRQEIMARHKPEGTEFTTKMRSVRWMKRVVGARHARAFYRAGAGRLRSM